MSSKVCNDGCTMEGTPNNLPRNPTCKEVQRASNQTFREAAKTMFASKTCKVDKSTIATGNVEDLQDPRSLALIKAACTEHDGKTGFTYTPNYPTLKARTSAFRSRIWKPLPDNSTCLWQRLSHDEAIKVVIPTSDNNPADEPLTLQWDLLKREEVIWEGVFQTYQHLAANPTCIPLTCQAFVPNMVPLGWYGPRVDLTEVVLASVSYEASLPKVLNLMMRHILHEDNDRFGRRYENRQRMNQAGLHNPNRRPDYHCGSIVIAYDVVAARRMVKENNYD